MPFTGLMNTLKLSFPPLSNQEADWLSESPDLQNLLANSNLYMIGQRPELLFKNYTVDKVNHRINFDLVCNDRKVEKIIFPCDQFFKNTPTNVLIEVGDKIIKVYKAESDVKETLIYWATPDKLLYDFSHELIKVINLQDHKKLSEFTLHYVGISKKRDSLTRLFKDGHIKRAKILSNETQITPAARLTDELFIFFFEIEDLGLRSWDLDEEVELGKQTDKLRLISDTEKAFIKILKCKYNTEDYSAYPKSIDGLFNTDVNRTSYTIGEDIIFHTEKNFIKGSTNYLAFYTCTDFPDSIWVDLDTEEVTLVRLSSLV